MPNQPPATEPARRAFTLVEVLVAMLFMVVVIPVALGGMRVAAVERWERYKKAKV